MENLSVKTRLKFLLCQVRNADDPMRLQEIHSFSRSLRVAAEQIATCDLLQNVPARMQIRQYDAIFLGGSGHYSATVNEPWLEAVLDFLLDLVETKKPTFASCWGFQAMAKALGGRVETHPERAELGTHLLNLTTAGQADPLFGTLPNPFRGQMGHEDSVVELPSNAIRLASTSRVENQAYRIQGAPIYCTQFHPELNRADLMNRVRAYPEYIEHILGLTISDFEASLMETPESEALLSRFVDLYVLEHRND